MYKPTTLIRLSTTDTSAVFDSDIYEDITIKPDSEIALNSLSIETEAVEQLTIDNTNNIINWKITALNTIPITLTPGVYDKNNIQDFVDDFNYQFNKSVGNNDGLGVISSNSYYNGLQWNLKLNQNGFTNIQNIRCPTISIVDNNAPLTINTNIEVNNLTLTASNRYNVTDCTITTAGQLGYLYSKVENNKGFGNNYLSLFNIDSTTPGTDQTTTFNWGVTFQNPTLSTISMNSVQFGIGVVTDPTTNFLNYNYISYNGSASPPVITPITDVTGTKIIAQAGDYLYHGISQGQIRLFIGRANTNLAVFSALNTPLNMVYDLPDYKSMSCWSVFVSDNLPTNVREIGNIKVNFDPFLLKSLNNPDSEGNLSSNFPIYTDGNFPTNNELNFNTTNLSIYLGYKNQLYNKGPSVFDPTSKMYTMSYLSENKINFYYIPENLIIEMLNIDLNSYDSTINKRKSILAILPNNNQELSAKRQYVYYTENPKYISVKNSKEKLIRNFQLRILDDDLTPIKLDGKATISILLR